MSEFTTHTSLVEASSQTGVRLYIPDDPNLAHLPSESQFAYTNSLGIVIPEPRLKGFSLVLGWGGKRKEHVVQVVDNEGYLGLEYALNAYLNPPNLIGGGVSKLRMGEDPGFHHVTHSDSDLQRYSDGKYFRGRVFDRVIQIMRSISEGRFSLEVGISRHPVHLDRKGINQATIIKSLKITNETGAEEELMWHPL